MTVKERPAPEAILKNMNPSEKAAKLLVPGMGAMEYFTLLVRKELFVDALGFIARMLPKRESVWWGCLCVEHAGGGKLPKEEEAALGATVHWVLDPTEENRQKTRALGDLAKKSTPAGCLAMAAFWSEGSISLPDQPEVLPEPDLTAKAVTGAVKIAATSAPAAKSSVFHRQFLALALEVAEGRNRWTEPK